MRKTKKKKVVLVVGGTSGLGLALATRLASTHQVHITGRGDREAHYANMKFHELSLSPYTVEGIQLFVPKTVQMVQEMHVMLDSLPEVDLLIIAAGFYQEGTMGDLNPADVWDMACVGLVGPALIVQLILQKQKKLPRFVAITSTSQWTPRLKEPMYTAVKAGLGMLAMSVALDPRVGKVLVAAPAGMDTPFWKNHPDRAKLLDPNWVADQILERFKGRFRYKFIQILREPPRVEEA